MEYSSSTNTTTAIPSTTVQPPETMTAEHFCKEILYYEIPDTRVRLWDVIIFVPNFLFLLFLIWKFTKARLTLRAIQSPIYKTFYVLVLMDVVTSFLRCVVSMIVNSATLFATYTDVLLWVVAKFFLLMTEISVVTFGLAFGHLDNQSSIRYVMASASIISLLYSMCQGALELFAHDANFHFIAINNKKMMLFGHGGVLFLCVTSLIFAVVYLVILIFSWILPLTRYRDTLLLPVAKSFYMYVTSLALLNICYVISGVLLAEAVKEGFCVMDVTTGVYFALFTPLVYYTFLNGIFELSPSSVPIYSYNDKMDEAVEDDTVSLPHQQSLSSMKTDSEYIYQTNSSYESTQFNATSSVNPLYVASLQSPDSITGYSLDSQIIDIPSTSKP